MASLAEDFRAFVTALPAVPPGIPIEKGKISEEQQLPLRIYYDVGSVETETLLSGAPLMTEMIFDVEVQATDDTVGQPVTAAIKTALNGYGPASPAEGRFGSSKIAGAFVEGHSDDYEPKLQGADEGYYLSTFRVRVIQ